MNQSEHEYWEGKGNAKRAVQVSKKPRKTESQDIDSSLISQIHVETSIHQGCVDNEWFYAKPFKR